MSKKPQLNVGVLQQDLAWEDPAANRAHFTTLIDQIAGDCDLIVLPEMFTTGFSMNAERLFESVNGTTEEWMKSLAAKHNLAICGSLIIKDQGQYFNRLLFVFPDGQVETYDKRHCFTLAKEHETFTPGNERLQVELHGWQLCPLICYDLRFPAWARNNSNYDVLLYVANWPKVRTQAWDTLLQARAIENMSYCIGVNRTGTDGHGFQYIGHSAVYNELGQRISTADLELPFAEVVQLDASSLKATREKLRFLDDQDVFNLVV